MMDRTITRYFNRFAGKEVAMKEIRKTVGARHVTEVSIAFPTDPVILEMRRVARDNGIILRFKWQGVALTNDLRSNRVNAHIEKGVDGKWRIANHFEIG